jgi:peptidyl-prolyl cis-trans isomerase D
MLKFLSKRQRSRNILLYGFIFLMTIGLIGFFSVAVSGEKGLFSGAASDDSTVAKVVGYKITVKELKDQLSAFGQQMAQGGSRFSDPASVYPMYGTQVLDGLIKQKLIQYEADKLGLEATDDEVRDRIRQIFNPWVSAAQYKNSLLQRGTTVEQFEDDLRASVSEEKLRSYVTAGVMLAPQEAEDDYRKNNTNYNMRWVEITPEKLKDKVQVGQADLENYFNQHKQEFRIDSEQRRARYILIDENKAAETVEITEDDLHKAFDPERAVKQVRVSQIQINVGSDDDAARKKADSIVDRAKGSSGKPGEDFGALAREVSEDSKTKSKGGDIGWVNKDDKRDADDPISRVFTMKKDEVSPPVKKGNSYYILKVTDRKQPTFEESRGQLVKEAREQKKYSRSVDIALDAEKRFKESKNPDSTAADINKQYGHQIASVKETPHFSQGDNIPELGPESSAFESAVFQLSNPGDIGDHQNVKGGLAIPQYLDPRGPHEANLDEVKTKVEDKYRLEKAKDLASQDALALAKAQTPDALKSQAEAMGLKADERAGITGNDSIASLITEESRTSIYKLNPGQVTPEPIKTESGDSYVVAAMLSRKDADMGEAFQKQRKSIEDRLLSSKKDMIFSTFMTATEKRLKDEGKIKVYQSVIDEAMRNAAESAPQVPGMPMPGGARPRQQRRPTPRR